MIGAPLVCGALVDGGMCGLLADHEGKHQALASSAADRRLLARVIGEVSPDVEARRPLYTALRTYCVRYPYPNGLLVAEIREPAAWSRCLAAARRLVAELDDGITMGAEEDTEAAVLVVREMSDPYCRAMNVHDRPSLPLLRFAVLLARAVEESQDPDGLTQETAQALARILACPCCSARGVDGAGATGEAT